MRPFQGKVVRWCRILSINSMSHSMSIVCNHIVIYIYNVMCIYIYIISHLCKSFDLMGVSHSSPAG